MSRPLHVADAMRGRPLADLVAATFGGAERAAELVRSRRVTLNGNLCVDAAKALRAGDVVKVTPHPIAAPPRAEDIAVRFLDEHLCVVEKPAGMTTMRYGDEVSASGRRDRSPTLLDLLPAVLAERLAKSGPPPREVSGGRRKSGRGGGRGAKERPVEQRGAARRGDGSTRQRGRVRVLPVHRLDRDTSGLMVFALHDAAASALAQMFRDHEQDRTYLAFALGRVEGGRIESFLADDRGDGRRGSVADQNLGKRAVTHVVPRETFGEITLVECRLETGRTHQIRIHLAERGHPICGDREYRGPPGKRPTPDRSGAPRLALHASGLAFVHPMTRHPLSFRAALPPDLAAFQRRLRRRSRDEAKGDGAKGGRDEDADGAASDESA